MADALESPLVPVADRPRKKTHAELEHSKHLAGRGCGKRITASAHLPDAGRRPNWRRRRLRCAVDAISGGCRSARYTTLDARSGGWHERLRLSCEIRGQCSAH